jgi:hypothetical protein
MYSLPSSYAFLYDLEITSDLYDFQNGWDIDQPNDSGDSAIYHTYDEACLNDQHHFYSFLSSQDFCSSDPLVFSSPYSQFDISTNSPSLQGRVTPQPHSALAQQAPTLTQQTFIPAVAQQDSTLSRNAALEADISPSRKRKKINETEQTTSSASILKRQKKNYILKNQSEEIERTKKNSLASQKNQNHQKNIWDLEQKIENLKFKIRKLCENYQLGNSIELESLLAEEHAPPPERDDLEKKDFLKTLVNLSDAQKQSKITKFHNKISARNYRAKKKQCAKLEQKRGVLANKMIEIYSTLVANLNTQNEILHQENARLRQENENLKQFRKRSNNAL